MTMKIVATITVDDERVYDAVHQEAFRTERTGFTVTKQDKQEQEKQGNNKGVVFAVEAKDASAFRAALNSITQMLSVYEQMQNIEKEERSKGDK